ncbi:uracil-DNA glycosylase family protein [Galbibacter mesophilus]|uniref:uracil-DNA glycosylase family protein n=1 Tax=Galbibacter mesophilus TaxID=379069 RepID=UPI00191D19B1|nr:uracil-DNA glycosylase family protein [Galbibacter mesophilus]MCM5664408.1 uracil-DNA glycosylase family protein [Galbibacter mesophilus]
MFLHQHPYKPFIPRDATKLIIGTLPPPRFTIGEFKPGDVDFCYGSRDGYLWQIIDRMFNLNLDFETTTHAVQQRKDFLKSYKIGICDIVESAERANIDASDLGMHNIVCRDIIHQLNENPSIETILFMGGNSKNGPEYLFRKQLKIKQIKLSVVSSEVPRQHEFQLNGRNIQTVSLTSPSGAANRAVGAISEYKELKKKHPNFNTIDFRVLQYKTYFK